MSSQLNMFLGGRAQLEEVTGGVWLWRVHPRGFSCLLCFLPAVGWAAFLCFALKPHLVASCLWTESSETVSYTKINLLLKLCVSVFYPGDGKMTNTVSHKVLFWLIVLIQVEGLQALVIFSPHFVVWPWTHSNSAKSPKCWDNRCAPPYPHLFSPSPYFLFWNSVTELPSIVSHFLLSSCFSLPSSCDDKYVPLSLIWWWPPC